MEEVILFGLSFLLLGMIFACRVFFYSVERDSYYEAFSLVQEELEKLIEEYKDKDVPSQRVYDLLCATDMFRKHLYKQREERRER